MRFHCYQGICSENEAIVIDRDIVPHLLTSCQGLYILNLQACWKVCSGAYFQICTMKGVMLIAIYHFHVKMVSRGKGKSAVGKAAYISGEKIKNEFDGLTHDYRKKKEIVHKEILLPCNAPQKFKKRSVFWNAVEKSETRKNSQTARDIDAALPVELSRHEQIDLVRNFCNQCFVSSGMCVDFAIHDKGDGNPHVHILLTTRHVDENGFTAKDRSWNDRDLLKLWRERWADWCNHKLYSVSDERIDHRSYAEQGIEKIPQLHLGAAACAIEKKGFKTDKGSQNKKIILKQKKRNAIDLVLDGLISKDDLAEQNSYYDSQILSLTEKINTGNNMDAVNKKQLEGIEEYIRLVRQTDAMNIDNTEIYRDMTKKIVVHENRTVDFYLNCVPFGFRIVFHLQKPGRGRTFAVILDSCTVIQ